MEKILFFGYTMDMGGAEKSLLDTVNFLSDKYDIIILKVIYQISEHGKIID